MQENEPEPLVKSPPQRQFRNELDELESQLKDIENQLQGLQ